jgi:hypothetical protein
MGEPYDATKEMRMHCRVLSDPGLSSPEVVPEIEPGETTPEMKPEIDDPPSLFSSSSSPGLSASLGLSLSDCAMPKVVGPLAETDPGIEEIPQPRMIQQTGLSFRLAMLSTDRMRLSGQSASRAGNSGNVDVCGREIVVH